MQSAHVYLDEALLASQLLKSLQASFFTTRKPANFVLKVGDLLSCILELLCQADYAQACIFEAVELLVDALVCTLKLHLQTFDLSDKWCGRGVVDGAVEP